ncbi:hypothetical protein LPJ53_004911 [Coemansia erecta]|uniref:Uncharacterized protein n=1 Tax=Coemansia erecta TaxID=147472 RepID=A0A9W8CNP7_9FUNG|nr:hypothetical protein LPJ53_004911 [Coemansia erecta]
MSTGKNTRVPVAQGVLYHICQYCGFVSGSEDQFLAHVTSYHEMMNSTSSEKPPAVICVYCGQALDINSEQALLHYKMHLRVPMIDNLTY